MKTKNGFTLVEVVVAMTIIGIVAVSMFATITSNINMLEINKQLTADAFEMQQEMEAVIETTRNNLTSLSTLNNVFEAGVTVQVQQVTHVKGNNKLYTLVASVRPPELPVPVLTSVSATLRKSGTAVTKAYALGTNDATGTYVLDASTASDFMVNAYYWYVSRPGFNMPMKTNPTETEMSTKYPKFPDDYELVTTSNTQDLPDITPYGGKHLVFTATPASKAGKLGDMVASTPMFISGLPVVNSDLLVHLDACVSNPELSSEVEINGTNTFLKKWVDQSDNAKNATQGTQNSMPYLHEQPVGGNFVGRYLEFSDTRSMQVSHNSLSGKTLRVFAIVQGSETSQILSNGTDTVLANGIDIGNNWRLVEQTYTASNNTITIGTDPLFVAEVIIYEDDLTSAQIKAVQDYLKDKYVPIDLVGSINALYNQTASVKQNQAYTPPSAVLADMSYGPDKYVPVTWTGTINTATVGQFVLTGKATSDNTKTCTLTVTVQPATHVTGISLTPSSVSLLAGETVNLVAVVAPTDADNKDITWSTNASSIASVSSAGLVTAINAGSAVITATTADGGFTASSTITVITGTVLPAGIILHLDASVDVSTSSSKVTDWLDQSGYGNDFEQTDNNKRPTLTPNAINGLPVISFSSTNQNFLTSGQQSIEGVNFFANGTQNFTIFALSKFNNTSGTQTIIGKSGGWGGAATYAVGLTNGNFAQVVRGDSSNQSTANTFYNVHMTELKNYDHDYLVNGVRPSWNHNNIGGANLQSNQVVLGATANGGSSWLNGSIAEILVFNRDLTIDEQKYVNEYLLVKWLLVKDFNFNSGLENWTAGSGIQNYLFKSSAPSLYGELKWTANDIDRYIQMPTTYAIDATKVKRIYMRIKGTGSSGIGKIVYKPGSGYTKNFTYLNDGTYQDVIIDLTAEANWTGTINDLKIYPDQNSSSGTFEVDFIRFLE